MKLTLNEKKLWNEAVKEAIKEMKRWDGIILDEEDRDRIADGIWERVAYKIKNGDE